jgi:ACS family hexuronate transporter-like MFS transporter
MKPIKDLRWWIATLLFLATLINYIDRQTLSVLAPLLREKFHMSNTDYSRVVFAFLLAYTFMQSGFGRIMDRLGTKRGFSLAIIGWSVAALLHAGVNSTFQLGICRFLLGAGEAGNWPGAVKAIAEWFPAKSRALAIGFFNSGSSLGAVIAPPVVAWIALHWGWRAAFLLTGLLGFLWLIAWLVFYYSPQAHPLITAGELEFIGAGRATAVGEVGAPARAAAPWGSLLRYRQVWGLVLSRMLADPVWWFYVFWLPEYLSRERHFSLQMIGYFAWIPFLTADAGNFLGGWLSGYLIRRGRPVLASRTTVMLVSAATMLAGIPAVLTENAFVALALISLATLAYSCWAANVLTLPADLFPHDRVASVSGMSGTGGATGGMIFTLITGFVLDRFSYLPIFVAAGLMPLAAAAIIKWGVRPGAIQEPAIELKG